MSQLINVEKIFAANVFTMERMRERLPRDAYREVKRVVEKGG